MSLDPLDASRLEDARDEMRERRDAMTCSECDDRISNNDDHDCPERAAKQLRKALNLGPADVERVRKSEAVEVSIEAVREILRRLGK